MSGVVCHYGKCEPGSRIASARIALYLVERYGFTLVDDARCEVKGDRTYDYCIVVSSAAGFAKPELRELVGELAARAGHYVFAQNDYLTEPAGQIGTWFTSLGKHHRRVVWSTIPKRMAAERAAVQSTYVNWNMLTWRPQPMPQPDQRGIGLFYYGACRRERIAPFKDWLNQVDVATTISSSPRTHNKWRAMLPHASYVAQMADPVLEMPQMGALSVYMEDEYSTRSYSSPANRLYEMLSAGMPFLIDRRTMGTFLEAGFERKAVSRYMPLSGDNPKTLIKESLNRVDEIAEEQRNLWGRHDYAGMLELMVSMAEVKIGLRPVASAAAA